MASVSADGGGEGIAGVKEAILLNGFGSTPTCWKSIYPLVASMRKFSLLMSEWYVESLSDKSMGCLAGSGSRESACGGEMF